MDPPVWITLPIPVTEPLPGGGDKILNVPPLKFFLCPFKTPETLTFISFALALVGWAAHPLAVLENLAFELDGTIVFESTPGMEIETRFFKPL